MFEQDLYYSRIENLSSSIDFNLIDRAKRYNNSSIFNIHFRLCRVGIQWQWFSATIKERQNTIILVTLGILVHFRHFLMGSSTDYPPLNLFLAIFQIHRIRSIPIDHQIVFRRHKGCGIHLLYNSRSGNSIAEF